MPEKFTYPILFYPEEVIHGWFDQDHEKNHSDYFVLRTDIKGGFRIKLVRLTKTKGREEIISVSSMRLNDALTKVHERYRKEVSGE